MSECEKNFSLTRRRFMAVSSAAVAAPFVMKMTGAVPCVEASEKETEKPYKGLKSVVIYYSQSGNTKKIGQAIQKGIISQTGQCDLVRVKEIKPEELVKYDLIGIGAPTWASCPSPLVIYFCKSLPSSLKGKHFFWFSTHGIHPGRCIIRGVSPLQEAGMTVIGWKDWYCDASLPMHGKPWYTDGHPDAIDQTEAEYFGKAMVVHSRRISGGQGDIIPKLHSKEASDQVWGTGWPFLMVGGVQPEGGKPDGAGAGQTTEKKPSTPPPIPSAQYYVHTLEGLSTSNAIGAGKMGYGAKQDLKIDPNKCIRCKLCVRGCPCNNIDDSVFPYAFISQDCEFCLYCEGICPVGAIPIIDSQLPNMPYDRQQVTGGGLNLPLDLAEATGRFRRLIKEEDVAVSTWERITGHPRFKELP